MFDIAKDSNNDDLFGSSKLVGPNAARSGDWAFATILEDPAILKIGQNMKYDAKILERGHSHRADRRYHAVILCIACGLT